MELSLTAMLLLAVLIFVVAALYSSVGHGGASGYLAVLALFSLPPAQMASTALILNVLVSSLAAYTFFRAGYFSFRLFWPFALASIPMAFIGGMLPLSGTLYNMLLALALIFAAVRLAWPSTAASNVETSSPPLLATLPVGGGIGLLSGMVGIGGGVFLSPVLMLARWATAKQTAAVAAMFILVNSLSGLTARLLHGTLELHTAWLPLAAAFAGGLLGSYWGAQRFSGSSLRRTLALVLLTAALKLGFAAF